MMKHKSAAASLAATAIGALLASSPIPPAWGLSTDRDQPIQLAANRADINRKTGISVYTGNVRVTRGSMHMTGDKVTVYSGKNDKVERIVAVGTPASYRQLPDHKKHYIRGQGRRIEYFAGQDRVILLDQAKVWQGGNVFQSNRIVYHISADVVNAGAANGKDRVHITIPPQRSGAR